SQHFSIAPSTGYHVDSLVIDGSPITPDTQYTFTGVTANHTIWAHFAINVFTITASAGSNGTITPSGAVSVNYNTSQHFSIAPATGYHVDSLIIDGSPITPDTQYTFTGVTANHTIRAHFAINVFIITASTGSNGTITPSGAVSINYNTSQHFSIAPATGYHVDSLIIDGSPITPDTQYTFTGVTANHAIRAHFAINVFTITASAGSNGTITPSGAVSVNYNTSQHFSIAPATGYHVDSLIIDGSPITSDTQYTFTGVTANHTIRVHFAINQFIITAIAETHGIITPSGSVKVDSGASQSFTIIANAGYHIDSVIVDGTNQGAISSWTFTSVKATHTIHAYFSINQFTITAIAEAHGIITPSGSVKVDSGASQSFTITSNSGYHIDSVIVDGNNKKAVSSWTFTNVKAPHTIHAYFSINQFTITAIAEAHGVITPSGSVKVDSGGSQSFTIAADAHYHIDSVVVDRVNEGVIGNWTFTNVIMVHTVHAYFSIDQLKIWASAGPNGAITPSDTVSVDYGSDQTFVFTPHSGYKVDSVFIDGVGQVGSWGYTFDSVTVNHTISGTFVLLPSSTNTFRTFVYDSLIVERAVKKAPVAEYWEFNIKNTTPSGINELNITFAQDVSDILSCGSFTPIPSLMSKKVWIFTGFMASGDSVLLKGKSPVPYNQKIVKLWLGPISGTNPVQLTATKNIPLLPMPNAANVRDEVYNRMLIATNVGDVVFSGSMIATGGFVVGDKNSDSSRYYGWVRMKTSVDMYRSLKGTGIWPTHTSINMGFRYFNSGAPFVGEQGILPPSKQNNKTFADLLTLKFNISMSMLGMTPRGFGELRYVDPGSPFDTMLVQDIAKYGDSIMTYAIRFNLPLIRKLDSTLMRINRAFSAPFDTLSWGDTLKLKATIRVIDTGILTPSGAAPVMSTQTITDVKNMNVPKKMALYQNYPNPFNPVTTIRFDLTQPMLVTLKVYNILGQDVATLLNNEQLNAGQKEAQFDGMKYASGVYFYQLTAMPIGHDNGNRTIGNFISVKKMLLVK
ncbi:MAG: T9SS type A sorting domain-containing protein, partial [Bacteroidota bacterium]